MLRGGSGNLVLKMKIFIKKIVMLGAEIRYSGFGLLHLINDLLYDTEKKNINHKNYHLSKDIYFVKTFCISPS